MAQAKPKLNLRMQTYWRPAQAYVLATVTLLVGIAVGYLLHGTESVTPSGTAAINAPAPAAPAPVNPAPAAPAQTASAEPLLRELQTRPNDPALLAQVGNTYY